MKLAIFFLAILVLLVAGNLQAPAQTTIINNVQINTPNGNEFAGTSVLIITNGGIVTNGNYNPITGASLYSSSSRTGIITDIGSQWIFSGAGQALVLNSQHGVLIITNNGKLFLNNPNNAAFGLGSSAGTHSNKVIITHGGIISNHESSSMVIGSLGGYNEMLVSDGGKVFSGFILLGNNANGPGHNKLTVDGNASEAHSTYLWFFSSTNNQAHISSGGILDVKYNLIMDRTNNSVVVAGNNSTFYLTNENYNAFGHTNFSIGRTHSLNNHAIVSNAGSIFSRSTILGSVGSGGTSMANYIEIKDADSIFSNMEDFIIGLNTTNLGGNLSNQLSESNHVHVSAGGVLHTFNLIIGQNQTNIGTVRNNFLKISDENSKVIVSNMLVIGNAGSGNMLILETNSALEIHEGLQLGNINTSSNSQLFLHGGSIITVTNNSQSGIINILKGTNIQNGGTILTDRLFVTNAAAGGTGGVYMLNGGTSVVSQTWHSNGNAFIIGNGTDTAAFIARGGEHNFQNAVDVSSEGKLLLSNATVSAPAIFATNNLSAIEGSGTINGVTTVSNGGIFNVEGSLTNVGNVNFQTSANIQTLDDQGDIFRIENGIFSNAANFTIEADASGDFALDFDHLSSFIDDGGLITWNFNAAPTDGHFGGIRSENNIFASYQNSSGFFTAGFQATGLNPDQYLKTYFSGTFYYLIIIPEPSTYALLVIGAICIGVTLRRRQQQKLPAD